TIVDVNVNAPAEQAPAMAPPTRTHDQILPRSRWVPFWDTVRYDKTTRSYSCQLDEQWLDLTKDTLRDALQITLVDNNNAFSSPPTLDVLIKFVNDLGYPKAVRTLSDVGLRDQGLRCYKFFRASSIKPILIMQRGCGKSSPNPSILSLKTKKNLARHTQGRKKANLIVILSVRFTKLIIHHLQSKHKFHPRPGSPLHLPNEESVLGYQGTKREVFGMPIPNNLINADIQGEQYYNAYLKKVAKHQRYLAVEEVSDPDSPAPNPAKATKPKETKQSKPLAPKAAPVTKPAAAKAPKPTASQPPKPTPATTEPSKKDQSKKASLQLVDEFVDEGVPVNEPTFGDEEADIQKAVEESLKDVHAAHHGPLPPVVIRKPESVKFQPLPEVQGKGKEKVGEEQAAQVLLNLQTPKKKSPADQFIFQRRTPAPTEPSGSARSEGSRSRRRQADQTLVTNKARRDQIQRNRELEKHIGTATRQLSPPLERKGWTNMGPDCTAIQAPLRDCFRDLPEADIKDILHHRIWETKSYEAHEDHKKLYEALEKLIDRDHSEQLLTDLAKARRKKKRRHITRKHHWATTSSTTPPPPPAGPSGTSGAFGASGSSQLPPPPSPPSTNQSDHRLSMDANLAPDEQVHSSDDEDIGNDHIPKVNLKQDWWKPLPEEDKPATPEPACFPSLCDPPPVPNGRMPQNYSPSMDDAILRYGQQVADLLSISKMKSACYPNVA
ncbi:monodehydroascorbate reductase, partial [Tanacetum coccineum]